jgi:hypothetical protein
MGFFLEGCLRPLKLLKHCLQAFPILLSLL